MFVQDGDQVDDLVLAWSGERPTPMTWGRGLFTLHRCLVRRGDRIEVWTTQSGRPTRILASAGVDEVEYRHRRLGGKFERILVDSKAFWIRAADRGQIESWQNR
jgi:hypothetical protein